MRNHQFVYAATAILLLSVLLIPTPTTTAAPPVANLCIAGAKECALENACSSYGVCGTQITNANAAYVASCLNCVIVTDRPEAPRSFFEEGWSMDDDCWKLGGVRMLCAAGSSSAAWRARSSCEQPTNFMPDWTCYRVSHFAWGSAAAGPGSVQATGTPPPTSCAWTGGLSLSCTTPQSYVDRLIGPDYEGNPCYVGYATAWSPIVGHYPNAIPTLTCHP